MPGIILKYTAQISSLFNCHHKCLFVHSFLQTFPCCDSAAFQWMELQLCSQPSTTTNPQDLDFTEQLPAQCMGSLNTPSEASPFPRVLCLGSGFVFCSGQLPARGLCHIPYYILPPDFWSIRKAFLAPSFVPLKYLYILYVCNYSLCLTNLTQL